MKPPVYKLDQNYPNPFNPMTTIRFALPRASTVALKVYDAAGREVATLVDERMPSGTHDVVFDATQLSSGVYFYRIRTDQFDHTRKLALLK